MSLIANCLTSYAEMERCFSSHGVTAFADHFRTGYRDTDVVDDCANQGSYEVFNQAGRRYSAAALAAHTTAREWGTTCACYKLTTRRGNMAPDSLAAEFLRIQELLKQVASSEYQLYGLALRGDLRPTWSNLQVDRSHRHSTIRVTQPNSSDAPTTLSQDLLQEGPAIRD